MSLRKMTMLDSSAGLAELGAAVIAVYFTDDPEDDFVFLDLYMSFKRIAAL